MLAVWAEMDVILADEFRDGNVPAMMAPLALAKRAFAALPETVTSFYYRGDSASHEKELLTWLRDEKPTARRTARRSASARRWILCREKSPSRKTRSRSATWRFAFVRGRRNCLPTAAGRSILPW